MYFFHKPSRTQKAPIAFLACRWRSLPGSDIFPVMGLQLDAACCYAMYNLTVGLTPLAIRS